jgi:hypothetical protein
MTDSKIGKIGVEDGRQIAAYELVVCEHVPVLDPAAYGLSGAKFDPSEYYQTSGEAVQKAKVLLKDLRKYAASITELAGETSQIKALREAAERALVGAQRMYDLLVAARGKNVFLECEWSDHRLWVIGKNPRAKPEL